MQVLAKARAFYSKLSAFYSGIDGWWNDHRQGVLLHGHPLYVSGIGITVTFALAFCSVLADNVALQGDRQWVFLAILLIILSILFFYLIRVFYSVGTASKRGFVIQNTTILIANCVLLLLIYWYDSKSVEIHVFNVFSLIIAIYLILVYISFRVYTRIRRKSLAGKLNGIDLVVKDPKPNFNGWVIATSILSPFRYLHVISIIVAICFLLFIPNYLISIETAAVLVVVCWTMLAFGPLSPQVDRLIMSIQAVFFTGIASIVSLFVIALAIAMVWDIHYLSDIYDNELLILAYLIGTYSLALYSNYWLYRFLVEAVLKILGRNRAHTHYELLPFGATRIQARSGGKTDYANIEEYYPADLLNRLRESGRVVDPDQKRILANLQILCRSYGSAVNVILVIFLVGPIWWAHDKFPKNPTLVVGELESEHRESLTSLLEAPNDCTHEEGRPKVALALSGGGTRAAIFGALVLDALAQEKMICDVFLLSGVSGGSASIAYFAANLDNLRTNPRREKDWREFYDTMSHDYIYDAIGKLGVARHVYGLPKRPKDILVEPLQIVRTGELLAEAFNRQLKETKLGDIGDIGLIFNATLAGSFSMEGDGTQTCETADGACECAGLVENLPKAEAESEESEESGERDRQTGRAASSELAGGRLVLTNLSSKVFPRKGLQAEPEDQLNYVVVNNEAIALFEAAALSANFPPVFANSAIDGYGSNGNGGCHAMRYWVTDGGAFDNRGAVSLLLALRTALNQEDSRFQPQNGIAPIIHVLIADASAVDSPFQQDRGIGSAMGAPRNLASGLLEELKVDLRMSYPGGSDSEPRIHFHQLTMPRVFRENGIGTNWMLPERLNFEQPEKFEEPAGWPNRIDELDTAMLISDVIPDMATTKGLACDLEKLDNEAVRENPVQLLKCWIEHDRDRNFHDSWRGFVAAFKDSYSKK